MRGKNDCAELDHHIVAKRGIRLQGRVQPALESVKVSILNELDEILVSMFTDAEGKYKFMPLHSDHRYRYYTVAVIRCKIGDTTNTNFTIL